MILKILKYSSVVLIFSLSVIILTNNYRMNHGIEYSDADKYLLHAIADHKFNESSFSFKKINLIHTNYFEQRSVIDLNLAAATSLFLISAGIILYEPSQSKNFFSEKFLFSIGFKNLPFKPPKYKS